MKNIEVIKLNALRANIANHSMNTSFAEKQIRLYEMFLSLIKKYPNMSLVPTTEIDKVWHYHIRQWDLYRKDCSDIFGYIVRHKRAVSITDKATVAKNYGLTNQLWYLGFNSKMGSLSKMAACGVDGDDGVSGPDDRTAFVP